MKELSSKGDASDINDSTEIQIPTFDTHSKTIGNDNDRSRITTHTYRVRCHPNDSPIFKNLLTRCSEDPIRSGFFITLGIIQITTTSTYRRHIAFQNNYTVSITNILIHGMTKEALEETVEKKPISIARIARVEENHLTESKGKWSVVTCKACIIQVKRKVDIVIQDITLQILSQNLTQPGVISKEYRKSS